jgi:hypothetical protein
MLVLPPDTVPVALEFATKPKVSLKPTRPPTTLVAPPDTLPDELDPKIGTGDDVYVLPKAETVPPFWPTSPPAMLLAPEVTPPIA